MSVTTSLGAKPCFRSSVRISFRAARLSRWRTGPGHRGSRPRDRQRATATRTTISSRCHRSRGRGRRCRSLPSRRPSTSAARRGSCKWRDVFARVRLASAAKSSTQRSHLGDDQRPFGVDEQVFTCVTTRVELTNRNGKTDSPQQAAHRATAFYPDGTVGCRPISFLQ